MSTLSPRPLLPAFLPSLNALLAALALPFTLDDPTDLTPSLLLAIFESLINARLPIPTSVRQSRTRDAKSRAMLVLLGVLECDVLRGGTATADADAEHSIAASNADDSVLGGAGGVSVDGWVDEIGLGEVDPERLADGGWEETIFVGELLCWLARRKGILPRTRSSHRSSHARSLYLSHHSYGTEDGEAEADFSTSLLLRPSPSQKWRSPRPPSPSIDDPDPHVDADFSALSHITDVPRHPLVHSPEPSLSASATTGTDFSIRARSVSSRTSVSIAHDDPDEFEEASQDTLQIYDPRQMMQDAEEDDDRPPIFRPRCIHDLEDPSYIRALAGPSSSFDPSVSHQRISEDEDEDEEDDPTRDKDDEADEQDNDDLYAPPTPTPQRIRLTGWIDTVDAATELSHFSASRSHSHSQSRAGSGSGSGPPSQSQSRKNARGSRLTIDASPPQYPGSGKSRTPRHASPTPSPPTRVASSPPPSPPSPTTHSDPPFDISFSTLNNTSTPAKPRPPRRPQFQTTARHEIGTETRVQENKSGGSVGIGAGARAGTGTGIGRPLLRRRDRSPSYTPSPPSFSTPGSSRSGAPSGSSSGMMNTGAGTRAGSTGPRSGAKTRLGATPAPLSTATRPKGSMSPPLLSSSRTMGKSPPQVAPAGSTATTNMLLTERARLLTELSALKRVRAAASGVGGMGGASGAGVGMETSRGSGGGVVGHCVGIGV